jgi:hypothetical protein
LVGGYAGPLVLWDVAEAMSEFVGCDVDLLDLRAASTVIQYQVITTGKRLWHADVQTGLFECFVLSKNSIGNRTRALDARHCCLKKNIWLMTQPLTKLQSLNTVINVLAKITTKTHRRRDKLHTAGCRHSERMVAFQKIAVHDYQSRLETHFGKHYHQSS